jgi:hypothetical protein
LGVIAVLKIFTFAVSVFLLLGNAVSCINYIPKEFWGDEKEVTRVFNIVVPKVKAELLHMRPRYECASDGDVALAEKIAEATYPYMQKYMESNGLTAPTLDEFAKAIGIHIFVDFDKFAFDIKMQLLNSMRPPDVLHQNSCDFLDVVKKYYRESIL